MNHKKYQRCVRCIMDTSVAGINFDAAGTCNFCKLHDKMDKEFPNGAAGKLKLAEIAKGIKSRRHGKPYDCIVGISGGRDSSFTLHTVVRTLGLKPLVVHFNNGFGNPVAGENMGKLCKKLKLELRTITSDWREARDIKLAFLKASAFDIDEDTEIGVSAALYGVAAKENLQHIIVGQSFRTEGIAPLSWNYLDGKYLKSIHKKYGKIPLHPWKPENPGFNLDLKEMFYYVIIRRIKTIPILYYCDYVRRDVDKLLTKEYDWVLPGAHYFDELYQSVMTYVYRTKFGVDRRIYNYSALIRSGQMDRNEALEKITQKYSIEDKKIIDLCLKRLGITRQEFESYMRLPPKNFRDFPNNYDLLKILKIPIKILSKMHLLPGSTYDKYFNCGV